jgi:hypothetical protein
MNSSPLKLKNTKNWFAAGSEVQQAMAALTDGAFKVFVHVCLNAERATGILPTTQSELARNLNKSHGAIRKYLSEMEKAGISQNSFYNNPTVRGCVQISPAFWPYENENAGSASACNAAVEKYIAEIKNMLTARACVRVSFSMADEILARQWFNNEVSLEQIEQAILLGCARKYVAWRNSQSTQGQILTLRYFEPILEEIGKQKTDSDYWEFLRLKIQRQEKLWIQKYQKGEGQEAKADNPCIISAQMNTD